MNKNVKKSNYKLIEGRKVFFYVLALYDDEDYLVL